jgi:glutathione S-transferase
MADATLIIGNKNYSSWSLRPWLACKRSGLEFDEVLVPLSEPSTKAEILRWTPSGRVPGLKHGDLTIWDSLAIGEYVAELKPEARLWPADRAARAVARAVSAEMHSGFAALREAMPMNIRSSFPGRGITPAVQEDINRITAMWRDCRKRFGQGTGDDLLFGHFTIADAMYAPVVTRFATYAVELDDDARAYMAAVMALPEMIEWVDAARREPMIIPNAEF